jgi:hypothetical protein
MRGADNEERQKDLVREAVLNEETFLRLTATGKQRGEHLPWARVVARPVEVRGRRRTQFSYFDGKKDITKNYFGDLLREKLDELLVLPFRQFHVQSTDADLYLRVTRKGGATVTRGKPSLAGRAPALAHDRSKSYPISPEGSGEFLQAIGLAGPSGRVRAAMQGKFRQINEFVGMMAETLAVESRSQTPLEIVDCGCGNAYLTFAAYHYLNHLRGASARVTGVDVQEDIIEKCLELRDALGWEGLAFHPSRIAEFSPATQPHLVLSLHACDTATDDAIAQGIRWGSEVILAAPCCQHELHEQLDAPVLRPLLRHGILKQRTADILTDAFRALVLRIMGYRTDVVQFVDPEHTAKNLMIRARKGLKPGDSRFLREYEELKAFWQVEPHIEKLLGDSLTRHLSNSRR